MRDLLLPLYALGLAAVAAGQVSQFIGPSPNLTTALDFDNPLAPAGPIAPSSTVFTSVGIASLTLIGIWHQVGDTLTVGSNVNGQSLVSQGGSVMTVAGPGAMLDMPQSFSGFEIVLASPVDEFQCIFSDEIDHYYTVQLFNGATSLGSRTLVYANPAFPVPPHYWRSSGPFDRIRLTFPNVGSGVGIDELAFGNGPPPWLPVNDECGGALVAGLGPTAFDTSNSTNSALAFTCHPAGADIWYRHTAVSNGELSFSTCEATYDTVLEVYTGACGIGLLSVGCDDDSCGTSGTKSRLTVPNAVAGTTYFIRIGGSGNAVGSGNLVIEYVDPNPASCILTFFIGGNFGEVGGNVYFDLTATQNVSISGLATNYTAAAGTPVGMAVWTTPDTHLGQVTDQAAWTQVAMDDGSALSAGWYSPTELTFAAPLNLTAGTYGICLQAFGSAQSYTNAAGTLWSANGVFSLTFGSAQNVPFTSPPFAPRMWNGQLCCAALIGTSYCTAVPNSTGNAGSIIAMGSAVRANDDVTLQASSLPNNSFGYFLNSRMQGFTVNPGGSMGNLCLAGAIGRYVGPGQIQNTGSLGAFSMALNLTQTPTPTGFVSVIAGETWSFQSWHRDSVGSVATSNFTNGLSISFL